MDFSRRSRASRLTSSAVKSWGWIARLTSSGEGFLLSAGIIAQSILTTLSRASRLVAFRMRSLDIDYTVNNWSSDEVVSSKKSVAKNYPSS